MIAVPLSAIPNQTVTMQLDNLLYRITVRLDINVMAVDVVRSNIPVVSGMRAVAGTPILPYHYLESGNFIFFTAGDTYPIYTQFGITQYLIYASQAELEQLYAASV